MARIRTIKPEFWADEKLAPLSPLDRLVFLGLVSIADDAGRLLDNVRVIDAQLFPETPDSSLDSLQRLSGIARIRRGWTASGQRIIEICNWGKHQKISHPNLKAAFPEIVTPVEDSEVPESLRNDSGTIPEPLLHHTNDQRPVPTTSDQRPRAPQGASAAAPPPDGGARPEPARTSGRVREEYLAAAGRSGVSAFQQDVAEMRQRLKAGGQA